MCDPPCQNGGLCVKTAGCACPAGWSGDTCSTPGSSNTRSGSSCTDWTTADCLPVWAQASTTGPVDCVLSPTQTNTSKCAAWSACGNEPTKYSQFQTRVIETPAQNGGQSCAAVAGSTPFCTTVPCNSCPVAPTAPTGVPRLPRLPAVCHTERPKLCYRSTVPMCQAAEEAGFPDMPCYFGPFCLNAQVQHTANLPYQQSAALDNCFPGIQCPRPDLQFGGWGVVQDAYKNTFCCLSAQCGSTKAGNVNNMCFSRGNTAKALACNAGSVMAGKDGVPNVQGESTPTAWEIATQACAQLRTLPAPEVCTECHYTGDNPDALTALDIAKIWVSATGGMTGAHGCH